MKTVEAKSKLIEIIKSSKEASELFEKLYVQENVTENEAILRSVAVALNHPTPERDAVQTPLTDGEIKEKAKEEYKKWMSRHKYHLPLWTAIFRKGAKYGRDYPQQERKEE